jgi:quercetin dioxygenase-like cupin family protein
MNAKLTHGVRRIVTGHDSRGQGIIQRDEVVAGYEFGQGEAWFTDLWLTDRSPADNAGTADMPQRFATLATQAGSVLRVVDIPPGQHSPMHRTYSVDYGIVLAGELDMELDGGSCTHLRAGDIVVQRGTNHRWVNRSSSPVRVAFVLIAAQPLTVDGRALTASH